MERVNISALQTIVACAGNSFSPDQLRWLSKQFLELADNKEAVNGQINGHANETVERHSARKEHTRTWR